MESAYFSEFGVNTGKYGPEKHRIGTLITYSVRMLQNADQNNFKYGHFLRSVYENFLLTLLWTNNKYSIHVDNTVAKIWRIFVSIRHHDKVLTLVLPNVFMVCKTP